MIRAFTSAAPNYLGKVRLLFESVRRHHPDWSLTWVCPEPRAPVGPERIGADAVFDLEDLALADAVWCFQHSLVELATAVKGAALGQLLEQPETAAVVYLDPDIVLFSALDEVVTALATKSILLTPHLVDPETSPRGILDNEVAALRHGVFNLGFLAVRNSTSGRRFAGWWRRRLRDYCRADSAAGLFTDQRWLDLAPGFFEDLGILRQARLNVAPWNIGQRQLSGTFDEGFRVDGEPLGFYHFTGFDGGAHHAMVGHYAPNNESLEMLLDWYTRRTRALAEGLPGGWSLGQYRDGTPIAPIHRRIYAIRPDLRAVFPDPYAHGAGTLEHWLRTQGPIEIPELRDASGENGRTALAVETMRRSFEESTSWRLTLPFRMVGDLLRRLGVRPPAR